MRWQGGWARRSSGSAAPRACVTALTVISPPAGQWQRSRPVPRPAPAPSRRPTTWRGSDVQVLDVGAGTLSGEGVVEVGRHLVAELLEAVGDVERLVGRAPPGAARDLASEGLLEPLLEAAPVLGRVPAALAIPAVPVPVPAAAPGLRVRPRRPVGHPAGVQSKFPLLRPVDPESLDAAFGRGVSPLAEQAAGEPRLAAVGAAAHPDRHLLVAALARFLGVDEPAEGAGHGC